MYLNSKEALNFTAIKRGFSRWCAMVSRDLKVNKAIYLIALPMIVYYIVFKYIPIAGVQVAFRDFKALLGIWGSPWVGLKHFERFVTGPYFSRLMVNTFFIGFYDLLFGFPIPILLALLLNEVRNTKFKSTVQTVTYMPHFVSMVVLAGMVRLFLSTDGLISSMVGFLNGSGIAANLMLDPKNFRTIYVSSGLWQNMGWNSILFLSAIASIDQSQYESAVVDGAGKFAQAIYITIPSIAPTIIMRLILATGSLLSVGFGKVFLLQNEANRTISDVVATYVYREGLVNFNYSYSAAVGLFMTVLNFIFLFTANGLSKKFSESSLF